MTLIYTCREVETVCINFERKCTGRIQNYTQSFINILYLGYHEYHNIAT